MASIQFVIQPVPVTDEQFAERLREVSDKNHKFGIGTHRIFEQLKIPVKEVVIGPSHIGVLLEDGKVFRVAFSLNSDRIDFNKPDFTKNNLSSNSAPQNNAKNSAPSSRQLARSRARLMRTGRSSSGGQGSGSRSSGVIIGNNQANRPIVTVPATYVPEELVSQAEVVLQGKSRNLIIRELQRTNLDVNLAVNNLLSRDDEETEETEDGSENYVPEDLISLLDNGFHGDNSSVIIDPADGLFSEEIFSNYSSIRNLLFDRIRNERNQSSGNNESSSARPSQSPGGVSSNSTSLSAQISSVNAEREVFSRWRDQKYYGPRRWLQREDQNWEKDADSKKKETSAASSPIWISEEIQSWPDRNGSLRFKKIAALYSEFIALSEDGNLHQWKWCDADPYMSEIENIYHPKTISLNITDKVEQISANFIRCSIVTNSFRVATWMDEQLGYLGAKLEHSLVAFSEFTLDPIISVDVCSLFTAVRTENNIFWWGVLPYDQRRYLWEKFRTKTKKPFKITASDIAIGTQVVMKKCPIYQTGSVGFMYTNGVPKVGQLLNSIWDFNDSCRMKILNVLCPHEKTPTPSNNSNVTVEKEVVTKPVVNPQGLSNKSNSIKESNDRIDMPPPPSPASSTCSETGISNSSTHKRTKRIVKDECETKKDEEIWSLKDVVFVDEKIGPIGKVLKVDGDFLAVRFPAAATAANPINMGDAKDDDWQQCRLLRREDIQIYKTAVSTRGPEWLQRVPKKINIWQSNENTNNNQLLAHAVDTRGIHVIKRIGSKIYYSLYNLYSSKQEQNSQIPTDALSFSGSSLSNIKLHCNSDCSGSSSTLILLDGNRTMYPFVKDCLGSIRDPHWLDIPPIKSISMSTLPLLTQSNSTKTKVFISALLFDAQKLMPHILRCDVKNAIAIINRLEKSESDLQSVLSERCDGSRNIIHLCVVMCTPTTNKDIDDKSASAGRSSTGSSAVFPSNSVSMSLDNTSTTTITAASFNPTSSTSSSNASREGRTVSLREMMNRLINSDVESANPSSSVNNLQGLEDSLYIPSWQNDPNTNPLNDTTMTTIESDTMNMNENFNKPLYVFDPIQRRENALQILQHLCTTPIMRNHLIQLLSLKDAQGQTPFMLAVSNRAYEAGIIILNTIQNIAEKDPSLKDAMIFPAGSPADQSPLHVICFNDTCSFTWTGADHINQNIYECKTCGLTGSLCCCTECARVCHKGHDCKLKRTSPTAYCDCWEKCKCRALIAGNQTKRFALLCKLTSSTDLVTRFNAKGESILLFLIQTVGRQTIEQRQYRANSRTRSTSNGVGTVSSTRKSSNNEMENEMPDHDLEPPRFARKALERLLIDWNAVRAMIMTGAEKGQPSYSDGSKSEQYNIYMQTQDGSTLLDKFTHNLIVKCSNDHLDTLLMTLLREMQNEAIENRAYDARIVARRFVRSVARVFVIFNLEKLPNPEKRKASLVPNRYIQSCVKVFQTLYKISIEELSEISEALIAPVRLGVVRPTAPFAMSLSNSDTADDLFSVDPLTASSPMENMEQGEQDNISEQAATYNLPTNYREDNIDSLRDMSSEHDETSNRDINAHAHDEDILVTSRNDEGLQDEESDNDFTFNEGETESDSDDNHSTHGAQPSVQTGATVGSETDIGVLFLEDESGESSAQEEEISEDGETDNHSDEFNYTDNQLERRNFNTTGGNDLAAQTMQWAIRNRETLRTSVRVPTGSNLVFIDPMALRRSTTAGNSAVSSPQEQHTMTTTASNLSRAFGILTRQISELLNNFSYNITNGVEMFLKSNIDELNNLQESVEKRWKPTWDWMVSVMDTTEAQLKFGAYLTNYADPSHPFHPLNYSSQTNNNPNTGVNLLGSSSRREFFSYCLSLMRAHSFEHRDALPVLDITALRHIAYVLDGFIYYMRNEIYYCEKNDPTMSIINMVETDDTEDDFTNEDNISDTIRSPSGLDDFNAPRKHQFFTRSESTLSLGCQAPDGFDLSLDVALPLADKPHLLQPNSKREDLFSNIPLVLSGESLNHYDKDSDYAFNDPPFRLSFSKYNTSPFPRTDAEPHSSNRSGKLGVDRHAEPQDGSGNSKSGTNQMNASVSANASGSKMPIKLHRECGETSMNRPDVIIAPNKSREQEDVDWNSSRATPSVIVQLGGSAEDINRAFTMNEDMKKGKCPRSISLRGIYLQNLASNKVPTWNFLLSRWKLTLDLFGRVFMDDVGMENSSILPELRGFPVKEMRFRRHMEKLRNGQQRDLILCKLERQRDSLILQTFKELNAQFGSQSRRIQPPLTFNRVKVTFKDEPGEGSGVARSFYTSIAEALLSSTKIPNLETCQAGSSKYGVPFSSILRNRGGPNREIPNFQRRGAGNKILWRTGRERKILNYDAKPYNPSLGTTDNSGDGSNDHLSVQLQQYGERLFPKIYSITPVHASKITGMLLEMPTPQLLSILSSEDILRQKVNEALELISFKQKSDIGNTSNQSKKMIPVVLLEQCPVEDNEPLFYSPGKRGFYSPRQGFGSYERLNAFRNVGRLIGLCLLQNELLPLYLQRHVLKYILGRKVRFHDLAFFDPVIYESFRQLIQNSQKNDGEEVIKSMDLYFVIDSLKEEGGGSSVELITGGRETKVTLSNVHEYIRRYTEYRLLKSQEKALEALRDGVFDVLPDNCMNSLTAEDLRLLLNGVGDINVTTLISYTTFNDESSEGSEKLLRFKRWFWSIVEKMNIMERQDLVYFWTGSPALPASEEGFQPLPSVTIRPADDSHLPTANTCISRLYIPLYSSKSILRAKILLAIKSKNFGFV